MLEHGYEIDISRDSVEVKQDSATTPLDEKVVPGILCIGFALFLFVVMVFAPGKHNSPSTWQDLNDYQWPSSTYTSALVEIIFSGAVSGFLILFGIRIFFPSGAELHCDRSTLAISKIPWYNLHGKWKSSSFAVAEISDFKFTITRRGRGANFYGFRFIANSRKKTIFTGIEAPEAEKIIKGLIALGVDVIQDPEMQDKIQAALEKRIQS